MKKTQNTANEILTTEVRKAMIEAGLTQEKLGLIIGISPPTVSNRFKDPGTWTLAELRRLNRIAPLSNAAVTALLCR